MCWLRPLRLLKPGGDLLALAPKDRGGARLAKELAAFGCEVHQTAKAHHKICRCERQEDPSAWRTRSVRVVPRSPRARPVVSTGRVQLGPAGPGQRPADRDPASARPDAASTSAAAMARSALAALQSEAVTELLLVDTDAPRDRGGEAQRLTIPAPASSTPTAWRSKASTTSP